MADLKHTKLWIWDLDDVFRTMWPLLGVPVVPIKIEEAYRAYEQKRVDGFIAVPQGALGFQWSAEARYVTELPVAFLRSCMLVSTRAFDALPLDGRNALVAAIGRGMMQWETVSRRQDDELLGGLFAKQGVKTVPVSEAFRTEFYAQARAVRDRLGTTLVRPELIKRIQTLLAEYRAEHLAAEAEKKK